MDNWRYKYISVLCLCNTYTVSWLLCHLLIEFIKHKTWIHLSILMRTVKFNLERYDVIYLSVVYVVICSWLNILHYAKVLAFWVIRSKKCTINLILPLKPRQIFTYRTSIKIPRLLRLFCLELLVVCFISSLPINVIYFIYVISSLSIYGIAYYGLWFFVVERGFWLILYCRVKEKVCTEIDAFKFLLT